MTRITTDYSAAQFGDYLPPRPVEEVEAGFLDALGPAFSIDNMFPALYRKLTAEDPAPNPNFDFDAAAKKSDLFARYPDRFDDVTSEISFRLRELKLAREEEERGIIASAGWKGVAASLIAGVTDPTILLPGGNIYKGIRGANTLRAVGRSMLSTSAYGALAVGVQETVLQSEQELRDARESATNIVLGAALGGLLGGVVSYATARPALEAVAKEIVAGAPNTRIIDVDTASSLSAARTPQELRETYPYLPENVQVAPSVGIGRALSFLSPALRNLYNPFNTIRALSASVDTVGLAFAGKATDGGDLLSIAKSYDYYLASAVRERDKIMGGHYLTRIASVSKFNEQVSHALRGGEVADPKVAEYAAWLRPNFFEPLRKAAEEAGLKNFQNMDPDKIATYVTRYMRKNLVEEKINQFQEILREHFSEHLSLKWSRDLDRVNKRNELDEETARILSLSDAEVAAERGAAEVEIRNLPKEFSEEVATLAQDIRAMRAQARSADNATRKKLSAQVKDLEKQNKDLLKDFKKREAQAKARFRLLDRTAAGIRAQNRKIAERIDVVLDDADATRARFVRSVERVLAQLDELSDESRVAVIEDLQDQLAGIEATYQRAMKRIAKEDAAPDAFEKMIAAERSFEEAHTALEEAKYLDVEMAQERIFAVAEDMTARLEQIQFKRQEQVKKLTGRLVNPNEAKAEAQGYRDAATQRYWKLMRRAAEQNVDIVDGRVKVDRAAQSLASDVTAKYLGEGHRNPFWGMVGERGPEMARMLDIDETRVWSNGAKFEDFLENDIELIMRRYLETVGPDIAIAQRFGRIDVLTPGSPIMKQLDNEVQEALDKAAETLTGPALEREQKKIIKAKQAGLRDLEVQFDRLRNRRGLPENPEGLGYRLGKSAKNLAVITKMGRVVASSLPDLSMIVMRNFGHMVVKPELMSFVTNLKAMKGSAQELRLAGVALDLATHARAGSLYDVMDRARVGTGAERALQFATNHFGILSLMDYWNTGMKQTAGIFFLGNLSTTLERVALGKASKREVQYLLNLGIDGDSAANLWRHFEATGDRVGGVMLPNSEDWGRGATDVKTQVEAERARRTLRAALASEVDRTIVTPGTELPSVADSNMAWRLFFQFKTFSLSSTPRIMIRTAQDLRSGDASVLVGMSMALALGAAVYYIRARLTSAEAEAEMLNADFDTWLDEAIVNSGLIGVLSEPSRYLQAAGLLDNVSNATGGVIPTLRRPTSKNQQDQNLFEALGPTASMTKDFFGVLDAVTDDKPGMTEGEMGEVRRLLPYNNLIYWGRFINDAFREGATR